MAGASEDHMQEFMESVDDMIGRDFAQAETLVHETGYHRRDPDLAELRPQCT